ncbi:Serpentine receptor class r-10 [Caenorhabditis elegans]|uniref:Serpentine receptor class r-10 n=1 Tax=Caenorhabditis elegans TaxID=6239 RepID=O16323_CAEEL|nr:Seven TM Receptor [Caenorhabditis elegans]CCD62491.1 Seven TM Receptor [Caenorhabditis elegans]|eukprot:NP_503979.1 Seven TM Receptor [Caenorhabditis elegans]
MLGKEWSALLQLVQHSTAVFSIIINTFLIYLILTKSPKQLGAYKWLMVYISVFEIFYSILDVVLVPQHYSHGSTFLVIVGIKEKILGPGGLLILNACYWGCYGASMAVFSLHFIYRWLVVTENPLLETFNGWKIILWFSIPLWYALVWISTGYILSAPNESTSRYIKDSVKEIFGLEFDEYVYLGPYLYEKAVNGNIHVAIKALLSLGIISVTIVSSLIIVLAFGILCYQKINQLVATTAASVKLIKLQRQLFYALVVQTIVPFVLMHIPGAIMIAFVFLDIDLGVYSAVLSMTIAIYPAVDPIPTLIIVENYRKTILEFCGCVKKSRISVTSTVERPKSVMISSNI